MTRSSAGRRRNSTSDVSQQSPAACDRKMMSFTIDRSLERVVSYSMLCKLAEQKHVRIAGNEFTGSFGFRGVEGEYECGEEGIQGKFAGHGVTGKFSFEPGKVAVTIIERPFWLPEMLLKQKISAGLNAFCAELV